MNREGNAATGNRTLPTTLLLTLVCTAVAVPAYAADASSGSRISVVLMAGSVIEGELTAVTPHSLVIADSATDPPIEVALEEVARVRIVRKSRFLSGLGIGALAGAASGAVIGLAAGDDTEGFFEAGDKAGFGAFALGVVGATVGAFAGGMKGVDQDIAWAEMTPGDRERTLLRLRTMSRYPQEYAGPAVSSSTMSGQPDGIPLPTKTAPAPSTSSTATTRSTAGSRYSRFHLGFSPAYRQTTGAKSLRRTIDAVGFGEDIYDSWGGWSGGISYPHVIKDSRWTADIQLEYSVNSRWSVGFQYAPLDRSQVDGHQALEGRDYRPGVNTDCYISGRCSGNACFLTGAFYPIPDGFTRKSTVRLGSGFGLAQADLSFSGGGRSGGIGSVAGRSLYVSRNAPAVLVFGELHYFFNRHWSLGLTADYKYAPLSVGATVIQTPYYYYASGDPNSGRREDLLAVSLPEQKPNLGGVGFGLSLRLHR